MFHRILVKIILKKLKSYILIYTSRIYILYICIYITNFDAINRCKRHDEGEWQIIQQRIEKTRRTFLVSHKPFNSIAETSLGLDERFWRGNGRAERDTFRFSPGGSALTVFIALKQRHEATEKRFRALLPSVLHEALSTLSRSNVHI